MRNRHAERPPLPAGPRPTNQLSQVLPGVPSPGLVSESDDTLAPLQRPPELHSGGASSSQQRFSVDSMESLESVDSFSAFGNAANMNQQHSGTSNHLEVPGGGANSDNSLISWRQPGKLADDRSDMSHSWASPTSRKMSTGSRVSHGAPVSAAEMKKVMQEMKRRGSIDKGKTEDEKMAELKARMTKRGQSFGEDPPAQDGKPSVRGVTSRFNLDGDERKGGIKASLQRCRKWLEPYCRRLNKSKIFQGVMFAALIGALFLPDIWIMTNMPNNDILDIILTVVLLMFLTELSVQSIGFTKTYVRSFFFYMDIIGALSLCLDLNYLGIMSLIGGGDSMSNNVAIMRAARMAKLGARAGRFTRLVKLLRFLPGMGGDAQDQGTAKAISARLTTALSTRISGLIIMMVMIMPLFSFWAFPDQDWSMTSWSDLLERTLRDSPDRLEHHLQRLDVFYEEHNYYPFLVEIKSGNSPAALPWTSSRGAPVRKDNVLKVESENFICSFNFATPNIIDSTMNVMLLVFIMALMIGFSLVLSNSVNKIVLHPVEKLLAAVRQVAQQVFKSVTEVTAKMEDQEEDEDEEEENADEKALGFDYETKLLERVVGKLGVLSESVNKANAADEAKANAVDLTQVAITPADIAAYMASAGAPIDAGTDVADIDLGKIPAEMVQRVGLTPDMINSWNFNPLELDPARNKAAVAFCLGPQSHGVMYHAQVMKAFLEKVEEGYPRTNPYHSWFHAVDVTHCVYRFLNLLSFNGYLGNLERFGLLVSAVGHDLGHVGFNNPFLVETSHEIALRYNDISPLENMHCAKLYELLNQPEYNIFSMIADKECLELRKMIIATVLHTDNAKHFGMIKEVQTLYELNSDELDAGKESFRQDTNSWPTEDVTECLKNPEARKLLMKLTLHCSDISNPMKPFRVCRIWALQVFEEMFAQGDQEKKLGVPVQVMNDREKVNRASSQAGFIELMVSPLLFAAIKVLPPLETNAEMLVQNAKQWYELWLKETKPPPSDEEKEALVDRINKLEKKCLELLE